MGECFEAAEGVCFDDDAVVVCLYEYFFNFFLDFFFCVLCVRVVSGDDDGHAANEFLCVGAGDSYACCGGGLFDGGEFCFFITHFFFSGRLEECFDAADLCFVESSNNNSVACFYGACVDDGVDDGAHALLFFYFKDGAFCGRVFVGVELLFEESLCHADECHEKFGDAFTCFCAEGDEDDLFSVIVYSVESF